MNHRKVIMATSMIILFWMLILPIKSNAIVIGDNQNYIYITCGPYVNIIRLYNGTNYTTIRQGTPACNNGETVSIPAPAASNTCNYSILVSSYYPCDPSCPESWYSIERNWYKDADGDSYTTGDNQQSCSQPAGFKMASELASTTVLDCNDVQYYINPGRTEVCDGLDNNCNVLTDEGFNKAWYLDWDGDGYRANNNVISSCACPGYNAGQCAYKHFSDLTGTELDCNDSLSSIKPGATEICDMVDNNCNGQINEGLSTDADVDGHYTVDSCQTPNDDCNDNDPNVTSPMTWHKDADVDGYTDGTTVENCFQPVGYLSSAQPGDCQDNDHDINPGAIEICDNVDNNCINGTDEGFDKTWYKDADGDGYTDFNTIEQCSRPSGYKLGSELYSLFISDCNDDMPEKVANCNDFPSCPLNQSTGSSNHVATGELTHDQTVFSTKGSAMPLNVELTYKSQSTYVGPLGLGWRHSYDMVLIDRGSSALFLEGNGSSRLYNLTGGAYIAAAGGYSTLVKNADNTYTVTEKDGLKYNFGTNGKIVSIIDRNGKTMTFSYTSGSLTSVTDPAGHAATFSYDANNKIATISDPMGNAYTFAYTNNRLTSVTNPDGGTWEYAYDASGYMITKTNPDLQTITYAYDANHRLLSSIDPENKTRSFTYPATTDAVRSTTFVEKDGGVWTKTYDITKGLLMSKTDSLGNTTSYTYDANGNKLTQTEPGNVTTSYTYDSSGNMLTVTNPLNQTTTYTYNSRGQVLTATDARGTITNVYDTNGNLTSVTDLSGATTTYAYDASGRVTSVTNALNQTTTFAYDTNGNLTSTTDVTGATTTFTYDANGNMITQTNSVGTTTFEYDGMNRVTKVIDPQGHETTNTYDKMGNLISVKDANNNTTTYEYNYKGQVTKVTDALSNQTNYTYSGTGCSSCGGGVDKLTALTDAKSQTTSYTYDLLGRLTTETDPLNKAISYSYDSHGNLISKTDANGQTITYTYDVLNRLTQKNYPDQTTGTYTYDATKGYLTSVANSNITYNMTYDNAGRITNVTGSGNTIIYEYNTLGQRTKATYPGNKVINYTYDTGRLQSIASDARTFAFTYDSLSRRTKLTYPNGTEADYSYDTVGRLTSLVNKITNGADIVAANYTYDNVGNRLSKTGTVSEAYQYDAIYRLTQATKAKNSESYTYDAVGNRLTGPGFKDTDYSYNADNQIEAGRKLNYTYDNMGNQKTRELQTLGTGKDWTLSWDYENRLIGMEKKKKVSGVVVERNTVTFKYDPFGRRIEKKLVTVKGGVTKSETYTYLYDNEDIVQETLTTDTTTEVTRYTHGPGIDEPLAMERNGQFYFYHVDGLGSITAITNVSKAVVQSYIYDSFGMPKPSTNFRNAYTYTGREWDAETGMYYNRARYYDPMAGRFLGRDPLGFGGGDVNLYNYVGNNPVNFIDPWGLEKYGDPDRGELGPLTNALDHFWDNFMEMEEANTIGTTDKFFHCMAHCQASKEGPVGRGVSYIVGESRELFDEYIKNPYKGYPDDVNIKDCQDDREANDKGREGGKDKNKACKEVCKEYKPKRWNPNYKGWEKYE